MSRRSHHGQPGHGRNRPNKADPVRRATPAQHAPATSDGAPEQAIGEPRGPNPEVAVPAPPPAPPAEAARPVPLPATRQAPDSEPVEPPVRPQPAGGNVLPPPRVAEPPAPARQGPYGPDTFATAPAGPRPANGAAAGPPVPSNRPSCTSAQLRRFIKSRPWIPMHELRRRFAINGGEDDVVGVQIDGRLVFVGLPAQEGRLLGDLLRAGEVGYELSLDPGAPIVIGVYPMRPVPRA